MLNFFIGFAFFEFGALCGFFRGCANAGGKGW